MLDYPRAQSWYRLCFLSYAHICGDVTLFHILTDYYLLRTFKFILVAQISSLVLELHIQFSWGEKGSWMNLVCCIDLFKEPNVEDCIYPGRL